MVLYHQIAGKNIQNIVKAPSMDIYPHTLITTPRSDVTNSVNGRIQLYTEKIRSLTTIFCRNTCDSITIAFSSVYRRICPYTTRRYTMVIRSHVNRHISVCGRLRPCLFDLGIFIYFTIILNTQKTIFG